MRTPTRSGNDWAIYAVESSRCLRRRRYATVLSRLPHPPESHHRRIPGRDRSRNRREQSRAAHSRRRRGSSVDSTSTASRATVARKARARPAVVLRCQRSVRRGAGTCSLAKPLSTATAIRGALRPSLRAVTQSKIAARSRRASSRSRSDTVNTPEARSALDNQRARSFGVRSRSNRRLHRSPTVARKSSATEPAPNGNSSSPGSTSSSTAASRDTTPL
jgi:hypothetical protein